MKTRWFHEREAWAFIGWRYLPWLVGLNLAWEVLQLPLYTIWSEASAGYITFAVAHCTLGDVVIGLASLVLALVFGREGTLAQWHWLRIVGLMVILGPGYTMFSEWLNTTLFRWRYSELMPTVNIGGMDFGVSPMLQWLLLPPLALYLARRNQNERQPVSR